ncbi:MAG: nucleotide exchange factor GrpE [Anaerolineaceae bacterium]|nr:nucleotide exchange factor GrpE [Anaerolineaceae bacterium]
MNARNYLRNTLGQLLQYLESDEFTLPESVPLHLITDRLTALEQAVQKLGKTLFKANALAEDQFTRLEKALALAQSTQEQNTHLMKTLADDHSAKTQKELLEVMLPALDGLNNAIYSGQRYLKIRDLAARKLDLPVDKAILVSPADRAILAGWLDGLRLVRERFLAILKAEGVTCIPTVGQPFDPYKHVVVSTVSEIPAGMQPNPGIITSEERCGYQSPSGVLRFAEVIIYWPD